MIWRAGAKNRGTLLPLGVLSYYRITARGYPGPFAAGILFVKIRPRRMRYGGSMSIQETPEGFEIRDGETRAAFIQVDDDGETWTLPHTVTDPAYRGQGLASQLVQAVVDAARERGKTLRAVCPYVVAWFEKHPDKLAGIKH